MNWRTPDWWYRRQPGRPITRALLSPLSAIWGWSTARRLRRTQPADPGVPVICVGNLTAGGSGKTPVAMEIARLLAEAGRRPSLLNKGHGGRLAGPIQVDPFSHKTRDVGDEALLMARTAPVWIAHDRLAGARAAAASGADVVVMDDGHQNPAVAKALSIVVVDGETRDGEWPFGAGEVIPRGPMRESFAVGLARTDAVVIVLPLGVTQADPDLRRLFGDTPVWIARWTAEVPPPPGPQIGFAGVAKPWKVARALKAAGCELIAFHPFADHAPIGATALQRLARHAEALSAGLVTTEKDWVRLTPGWQRRVSPWRVAIRFLEESDVAHALMTAIG